MTHNTEPVGFPAIPLSSGMKVRLNAVSPTLDAAIAGVTSTRWSIYGYDESDGPPETEQNVEWLGLPVTG